MGGQFKECALVQYDLVFKEIKTLEDQLSACINQYEERLKRVNEYMEQSNGSYIKA